METAGSKDRLTGGCQCGAVRYELAAPPHEIYVCHCRECQKQSSSAFGISAMAWSRNVRLVQGTLRLWSRGTDSGGTLTCFFCADCGSRVWHGDPQAEDEISIKGGTLDRPLDLSGAIHIWTDRKLEGVIIPDDARQFPGEPS